MGVEISQRLFDDPLHRAGVRSDLRRAAPHHAVRERGNAGTMSRRFAARCSYRRSYRVASHVSGMHAPTRHFLRTKHFARSRSELLT